MCSFGERAFDGVWRFNKKKALHDVDRRRYPFVIRGQNHAPYRHGIPRVLHEVSLNL